ncbi:hypothetical protein ACS0TY_029178 [Phlomoides rotata]
MLVDEIWHAAGDKATDIDWFMFYSIIRAQLSSKRKYTLEIKSMKCGWSGLNASSVKFN